MKLSPITDLSSSPCHYFLYLRLPNAALNVPRDAMRVIPGLAALTTLAKKVDVLYLVLIGRVASTIVL